MRVASTIYCIVAKITLVWCINIFSTLHWCFSNKISVILVDSLLHFDELLQTTNCPINCSRGKLYLFFCINLRVALMPWSPPEWSTKTYCSWGCPWRVSGSFNSCKVKRELCVFLATKRYMMLHDSASCIGSQFASGFNSRCWFSSLESQMARGQVIWGTISPWLHLPIHQV